MINHMSYAGSTSAIYLILTTFKHNLLEYNAGLLKFVNISLRIQITILFCYQ
jgi:hypothetical protein